MPRAVWSGMISFGLVSVPVRLYPATRRKDVRFHELDRLSGQRIRHQRVVEPEISPVMASVLPPSPTLPHKGGGRPGPEATARRAFAPEAPPISRPVAPGDVLKGFEITRDHYVTGGREELEELAPERSRTIDVEQFVEASTVDPIYYDVSYYAVPERGHERAYGLLVDAMQGTGKIAISWFVLRRKRYLAALRPQGPLMVLSTMFHADEILPAADLEPARPADLSKKEREMATLLVNILSGPFEPDRYPDEYRQRVKALIEGRAAAAQPATAEVVIGSGVNDLMAALRASVEAARRAPKARAKPVTRRKRKTA